jgi:hypothetical protein
MDNVKFTGSFELEGVVRPLTVSIGEPIFDDRDYGSYFCEVYIIPRFERVKRIFGADSQQARELARQFVLNILDECRVLDGDGREVQLTTESLS